MLSRECSLGFEGWAREERRSGGNPKMEGELVSRRRTMEDEGRREGLLSFLRRGGLSKRRPARDIKGCCAAAPTGETREGEKERNGGTERRTKRMRGQREGRRGRRRRGIPWRGGSQGTKGSGPPGVARRGEARLAFGARAGPGPRSVRNPGEPRVGEVVSLSPFLSVSFSLSSRPGPGVHLHFSPRS